MKNIFLLLLFLLFAVASCEKEAEEVKITPQSFKITVADSNSFFHIGYVNNGLKNYLYKTNAKEEILWIKELQNTLYHADLMLPLPSGGVLYAPLDYSGTLKFYNANGKEEWVYESKEGRIVEVFLAKNELWLIQRHKGSYSFVVIDQLSGTKKLAKELSTIPAPNFIDAKFTFHEGKIWVCNPVSFSHTEISCFNKEIFWQQQHPDIPSMIPLKVMFRDDRLFVIFNEKVYEFSTLGDFKQTLIKAPYISSYNYKITDTGQGIAVVCIKEGRLQLITYSYDFVELHTMEISEDILGLPTSESKSLSILDYQQIDKDTYISLSYTKNNSNPEAMVIQLKQDGTLLKLMPLLITKSD